MPGKLQMPTGFEDIQQKAANRRKLADMLSQLGLQSNQNYHSWAQVAGQLADAWAGRRAEKQADKLDNDYTTKLTDAYTKAHEGFQADVSANATPEALQAKYGNNPYTENDLKPYAEAIGARLKTRAEQGEQLEKAPDGSYKSKTSMTGPQFDPNSDTYIGQDGQVHINPVKITASRLSQATGPAFGAVTSMPIPGPGQPPVAPPQPGFGVPPAPPPPDPYYSPASASGMPFTPGNIQTLESGSQGDAAVSPKGAIGAMQVMPSTAHNPGYGVRPASSDSPAEYDRVGRDYAQAMLQRYHDPVKAAAAYNGGPGRTDQALAASGGNFLSRMPAETQAYAGHFAGGMKPPTGKTIDGRDYWMINGVAYDNPEGK